MQGSIFSREALSCHHPKLIIEYKAILKEEILEIAAFPQHFLFLLAIAGRVIPFRY